MQEKFYRIKNHPILSFPEGKRVRFYFEGKELEGFEGEPIACALIANGIKVFRWKKGRPRGFFCAVGKCSSCLMTVDGKPNVMVCMERLKEGMRIERPSDQETATQEEERLRKEKEGAEGKDFLPAVYETDLVIIGAGPAGLSASLTLGNLGVRHIIVDDNPKPGGQLLKQTHKFFGSSELFCGIRGFEIARILKEEIEKLNCAKFFLSSSLIGAYRNDKEFECAVVTDEKLIKIKTKALIGALGACENFLLFENNDLPGIYGAGAVQTLMNLYGIRPGKKALMVGSGNIGLIVTYQMLQAGIEVLAIVEIMPEIGGYHCHAAKIRRMGIPILLSHTVKRAIGKDFVQGVVVVQVDKNFQEIKGTEKRFDCDLICLSVGLAPLSDLFSALGCKISYIPELGGYLPYHDEDLKTSIPGVFVAGDASGIEEASTAILEGRIAGSSAYEYLFGENKESSAIKKSAKKILSEIRQSPFLKKIEKGLKSLTVF
ncbi:MAG: FAD-dependent oxidoreductase [candidate division WOR-3 bacterium]